MLLLYCSNTTNLPSLCSFSRKASSIWGTSACFERGKPSLQAAEVQTGLFKANWSLSIVSCQFRLHHVQAISQGYKSNTVGKLLKPVSANCGFILIQLLPFQLALPGPSLGLLFCIPTYSTVTPLFSFIESKSLEEAWNSYVCSLIQPFRVLLSLIPPSLLGCVNSKRYIFIQQPGPGSQSHSNTALFVHTRSK